MRAPGHPPAGRFFIACVDSQEHHLHGRQVKKLPPCLTGLIHCPQGHAPTRHGTRQIAPGRFSKHAFFAGETCRSCPNLANCPVRGPNTKRRKEFRLDISKGLQIRDEIFVKQTEPEWQKQYRIRSGVEATMSELKRTHGIGALRVRTLPRVSFAVGMKVMACNIKRWLRGMATNTAAAAA